MGSLSGSTTILAGTETFNLSSPAQTDWIEYHSVTTPNRKSGGGSTIGLATVLGSGVTLGTFTFGIGYTWTDGTPQASGTAVTEGIAEQATTPAVGQGFQFTLPADTTSRTVTIYWGGNSCATQLVATLSDGSATAVTHTPTATGAGNPGYYSTTLTYAANAASQTLTIACTVKTLQSGGNTWLGAAKYLASAATVTGAAASTQQSNVSTASASVGVSASAASTQASDVSAASGKVSVSGASTSTQTKNSSAGSGVVIIGGSGSSIQAANSSSTSGLVLVAGAGASTQQANASTGSGAIKASGSSASTQAPNVSSAAGAIGNIAQGSAASTQAANLSAATGAVSVFGSGLSTQAAAMSSGAGTIAVSGANASTQNANVSTASGSIWSAPLGAAAASVQNPNTALASGAVTGPASASTSKPIQFVVPAERRSGLVAAESRCFVLPSEARRTSVSAELRRFIVPPEKRQTTAI
jgi:hypothetical protein